MGSLPGPRPSRGRRATRVWRTSPHIAYVTPSRLATRIASSNSPSACACHLDVVKQVHRWVYRLYLRLYLSIYFSLFIRARWPLRYDTR